MNDVQLFKFENQEVRTVLINNEPYFVGKDVAKILGYSNPQKAIRVHVYEEDKGRTKIDTPGGIQEVVLINESGLYSLILSSKLPTSKKFKRWVTKEVLPAIRKTSSYSKIDISNLSPELQLAKYLTDSVIKQELELTKLNKKVDDLSLLVHSKISNPVAKKTYSYNYQTEYRKKWSEVIINEMYKKGLTTGDIARELGYSTTYIYEIIRGNRKAQKLVKDITNFVMK
jgi:prophage antirepressor-like protein